MLRLGLSLFVILFFVWSIEASDSPQQIHIALAGQDENGNPNGMTISWQTVDDTSTSTVKYGIDQDNLAYSETGTSSSYYATFDHHVVLQNLESGTKYFYQCGDETAGWSDVSYFKTAPMGTTATDFEEMTLAVIGDMGVHFSPSTIELLSQLGSEKQYEMIWHLGDVSYADDGFLIHPFQFTYETVWNEFMNEIQDFSSVYPYMVLPGNHEAECHSPSCQLSLDKIKKLSHFAAYNNRFRMPSPESNGTLNMWYSFNYGPIHFVNIDTETDYENAPFDEYTWMKIFTDDYNGNFGGDQIGWLKNDLEKASEERDIRPWIFVAGHRPIYSVSQCDSEGKPTDDAAVLQEAIEDLLHDNGVDVYFAGHKHSYERQYPIFNSNYETSYDNPSFPVYIVDGSAGNIERLSDWDNIEFPAWNVHGDNTNYGMSLLTIYNSSTIRWKHLNSANGEILDEFVLYKDH